MTVTQERVCSHCHHETVVNPWMKPEIVLLSALGTFGISAIIWAVTSSHDKPIAPKAQQSAAVAQTGGASEMERLFAQAGSIPVVPRQRVRSRARLAQKAVTPAAVTEPELPSKKITAPEVAQPAPSVVPPEKVDDVAQYNKVLADFFERQKTAEPDTTDGAEPVTKAEPPSYEEWLQAGKPSF